LSIGFVKVVLIVFAITILYVLFVYNRSYLRYDEQSIYPASLSVVVLYAVHSHFI